MIRYKQFIVNTFILIFMVIFFSCNREKEGENQRRKQIPKQSLEEVNKLLIEKDAELIKSYVNRRGWKMEESNSGLWYMIYEDGEGEHIKRGDFISFNYRVNLLDGTFCYSSEEQGPKSIVVGKGGVESGLEECVLLLKSGSKARFILPPHLAHGLIGDENKIPARAIIIYDIEILTINQ